MEVSKSKKTLSSQKIKIFNSWLPLLEEEFQKDYMHSLRTFLQTEYDKKKTIYPKSEDTFAALNITDFDKVKVVILGQDPYHGPGQAHGLSFSVNDGVRHPPSLKNIFKELHHDLGKSVPESGNLSRWAKQGVLLLNATLSVEAHKAGSHQKKGWEEFTDRIIRLLNDKKENLVFILWGSYAQKKGSFIDTNKHLVLKAVHPSPLSAHRGFFGSKPFSQANSYLEKHNISGVDW